MILLVCIENCSIEKMSFKAEFKRGKIYTADREGEGNSYVFTNMSYYHFSMDKKYFRKINSGGRKLAKVLFDFNTTSMVG